MIKSMPSGLHKPVAAAVRRCLPRVPAVVLALVSGVGAPVAGAQEQADTETVLEEVVVNARFREENLQETPLAISSLTASSLEARSITNIQDLGATIPNAYIRPAHAAYGGSPVIRIRGVGQIESLFAFEPGVGVYIDDVYHATLLGSSFDLMDLEQVDVLRGPQGTLFGKNSLGGAIVLRTRKPSETPEAYVGGTFGSRNRMEIKGGFSAPLIDDKLYVRLAGVSRRQDGYQDVIDFRCQMIANGTPQLAGVNDGRGVGGVAVPVGSAADDAASVPFLVANANGGDCNVGTYGGTRLQAGRVSLLWKVSDKLEINTALDYTDQDDEAPPLSALGPLGGRQLSAAYRSKLLNYFGFDMVPATATNAGDSRFLIDDPYKTYYMPVDIFTGERWTDGSTMQAWGFAGTAEYKQSEAFGLKLVAGYRSYDNSSSANRFAIPLPLNMVGSDNEHEQKSLELQLYGSTLGGSLDWTLGGFFLDTDSLNTGRVVLDSSNLRFSNNDRFNTENKSVFLHLVHRTTDRLSLSGGLRYTDESKDYQFHHPGNLPVNPADPPIDASTSFDRVDWKVGADYRITDSLFTYVQAATGFRSPGFNPRPFVAAQLLPFSEEELTSYEAGFKGDWLDGRLRTNLAVFLTDYDKWVLPRQAFMCANTPTVPVLGPGDCAVGVASWPWQIFPVGKATSRGVELEMTAVPLPGLDIEATLGWNKLEPDNDSDPTQWDYVNPDVILSPELNASLAVQYRVPLPGGASLTPRVDWSYTGEYTLGGQNTAPTSVDRIPSLSLVNARLTFEPSDGDWSVSLSGTNLTNKFYWVGYVGTLVTPETPTAEGGRTGAPSRPREWAISFQHRF